LRSRPFLNKPEKTFFRAGSMFEEGSRPIHAFGECEIDLARRELRVLGSSVPIGGRAFEIIEVLVQSAGELVTKDEVISRVWPGAAVNDNALQVHISAVRKALGPHRALLKTESGRGYRLLGTWTVRDRSAPPAAPPVAPAPAPAPPMQTGEGALSTTNFPMVIVPLVGREAAAWRLRDLVSAYRVVTLTGPGGIGKTALALHVARELLRQFADGGWLVELASLADPGLVPFAMASALGLKLVDDTVSSEAVARAIDRRNLLLVLDNCEHVVDAAAELIETIVRMCPHITIMTTSREILRIEGEYVYRVAPLDVPAEEAQRELGEHSAVELFIARATALDTGFSVDADRLRLIAAICRHLDGIPLAIEFAAARTAALGLEQVASGLRDRFALLTSGRRTALPRHQTLRATLDWSYDLLPDEERLLLRHLAMFPAAFTLDAAVAVARSGGLDGPTVVDGLANLVAKSLVTLDAPEATSRWRLLETTRAYALEKLAAHGEAEDTARCHAAYFRDFFAGVAADFSSRLPTEDLTRHGREIDNVRAALDWSFSPSADVELGIELTAAYTPVWMSLSLVGECRERCERALQRLDPDQQSNARLRMQLQIGLGITLVNTLGPSEQAQAVLTEALETADALGDLRAQARILSVSSSVHVFRGEYDKASATSERLRRIAEQIGDASIAAFAERRMGFNLLTLGRLSEARQCLERVVQFEPQGDERVSWQRSGDRAMARAMLARAFWLQGFADRAHREAQTSLDEIEAGGHKVTVCRVLNYGVCRIAPMTGDFATAERTIARLAELAVGLNTPFWMTAARFLYGKLLVERREFAAGLTALREAFDTCDQTGWRLSYPEFSGSLTLALAGLGQLAEAYDVVNNAIVGAGGREYGQVWYVPELLRIKAELLLQQTSTQAVTKAKDCLDQAAELAREQGALFWELRIALSLARLHAAQGQRDEAKNVLTAVYTRFTEGFETADLQAARALLDELEV
jgi:predicted ATPase/DNA-binding winged helix-turn-helix (wHTH) protein